MDTTYGVLCLIPPIVAIGLALWTKQTIFSLFIAVWLGSTMMNGFNPLVGFVKIISDYMIPSLSGNASLIILVTLSGGMIAMLRTTGAAEAFATRVTKVINTAKKGRREATPAMIRRCLPKRLHFQLYGALPHAWYYHAARY